jgi:hypothetical protein
MNVCNCIKSLDITECIKKEELRMYPCLEDAVYTSKIYEDDDTPEYINNDKLITILFRAIQELKNEIDMLKAN